MIPATEVPFDASKYAFRTDFDGLDVINNAAFARLDDAKKTFQNALQRFASQDKNAREEYADQKMSGLTESDFGKWVSQNFPSWIAEERGLEGSGSNLTRIAADSFGDAYTQKLQKQQSELAQAAYQAGQEPKFF